MQKLAAFWVSYCQGGTSVSSHFCLLQTWDSLVNFRENNYWQQLFWLGSLLCTTCDFLFDIWWKGIQQLDNVVYCLNHFWQKSFICILHFTRSQWQKLTSKYFFAVQGTLLTYIFFIIELLDWSRDHKVRCSTLHCIVLHIAGCWYLPGPSIAAISPSWHPSAAWLLLGRSHASPDPRYTIIQ